MQRRDFVKLTAPLGAGSAPVGSRRLRAAAGSGPHRLRAPDRRRHRRGAPRAARPGEAARYHDVQQRTGANAFFPFIYSHIEERAGVHRPGFRGGNYAIPHMQYYKDTILTYEDMRGPEFGDKDLLALAIAAGKPRGIKTFAWIIEDNRRPDIPRWAQLYEVDFHGRRTDRHPAGPCNNNPYYRGYLLGLVEDYARSYDIDGVMWGSERQPGLFNALGAYHNGAKADPGQATCFCEFCLKKGRDQGIDAERARAGFGEIEKFVRAGRAGHNSLLAMMATSPASGASSSTTRSCWPGRTSGSAAAMKCRASSIGKSSRSGPSCRSAGTSGTTSRSVPSTARKRTMRT